jgi:hypothetical protein
LRGGGRFRTRFRQYCAETRRQQIAIELLAGYATRIRRHFAVCCFIATQKLNRIGERFRVIGWRCEAALFPFQQLFNPALCGLGHRHTGGEGIEHFVGRDSIEAGHRFEGQ